ncbi:MAG TPA: hypothetical protein VF044_05635 [Actinomycetota bacterium]
MEGGSTYEDDAEGIPDHVGVPASKRATGGPEDERMPPGEEPRGADAWGTTAREQREGEPLGDRLAEEEPDRPGSAEPADDERLIDDGQPDRTAELTGEEEPEPGGIETPSAEELAVHERDAAPGGTDAPDTYVEDEGA